jgi:hypothetical protein
VRQHESIQLISLTVVLTNPANDVPAGSFAMHRVKNAFSGANDALSLALLKKAQNLIDLGRQYYERERTDRRYQRYIEPDYSSMLGSIVGITDEVGALLGLFSICQHLSR